MSGSESENAASAVDIIAGLETIITATVPAPPLGVVMLHGYAMSPEDLAPFAVSMNIPARFFFPRALYAAEPQGHAWWPIDQEARSHALRNGPRDLASVHPPGLTEARTRIEAFMETARQLNPAIHRWVLAGFSQGGMLTCEVALRMTRGIDGLILMSTSRLAYDTWLPALHRLSGIPALISHGTEDTDLAFGAGERLRDALIDGGALVQWVPFSGGHQIPLAVWRQIRKFLGAISLVPDCDALSGN